MTFEGLVDRLVSLYDVGQQRAVDVANERLSRMVAESTALRSVVSLGTTVAAQASYALAANVVKVLRVEIVFSNGTTEYEGVATLEDLMDVAAGRSDICGAVFAIEADSDSLMTTDNIRFYPAPAEASKTISGLVAIRPATLTYSSATALPIPIEFHPALLAGCEAELSDEEGRQDEASKGEIDFAAGIKGLEGAVNKRGKGSDRHRMRVVGYDMQRR